MPALTDPVALPPNRIGRFYRGGALLESFRGLSSSADANEPEDWVGSVTSVWQPSGSTDAGLSRLPDGRTLRSLVGDTGVLVKLLDAAERLPIHCHPTRPFAQRVLDSAYGKAEAWIVLETRRMRAQRNPTSGSAGAMACRAISCRPGSVASRPGRCSPPCRPVR
jgi:mannose-6-phosphate isomerase